MMTAQLVLLYVVPGQPLRARWVLGGAVILLFGIWESCRCKQQAASNKEQGQEGQGQGHEPRSRPRPNPKERTPRVPYFLPGAGASGCALRLRVRGEARRQAALDHPPSVASSLYSRRTLRFGRPSLASAACELGNRVLCPLSPIPPFARASQSLTLV
jgi:hypothetical protein